jgi:hypothetical protein
MSSDMSATADGLTAVSVLQPGQQTPATPLLYWTTRLQPLQISWSCICQGKNSRKNKHLTQKAKCDEL